MKPSSLLLSLFIFVVACKNGDRKETGKIVDSATHAKLIRGEDSALLIDNKTSGWIANHLEKREINWSKLVLEEFSMDDTLKQEPFSPEENFYNDYAPVLRWSPDSNYVLDIGSYGAVLVTDEQGNTKVESGEADSEISLIEPKKNNKTIMFFVGPSSNIFDGGWVDKENALILGSFDETGQGVPDTLFWLYNVKTRFFRMYKWRH